MYPAIVDKLGCLFAKGGTYRGVGNVANSVAEFNVQTDVEATAAVAMGKFKQKMLLQFDVVLAYTLINKMEKSFLRMKLIQRNLNLLKVFSKLQVMMETTSFLINISIVSDGQARGQVIIDWLTLLRCNQKSIVSILTAFEWDSVIEIATKANQDQQ
ncbi:unnamed protein product [Paramecium primaurelia]|uniref:Inosine/uridine-preferring nucleoside hydrolase domain-containing protein n=1 Tax=Paramecium primaurelia TaxID=5886 RepID=A0A8S1M8Z3_PARPR|nr:unnamed protein product [Paramecium primaurelia]